MPSIINALFNRKVVCSMLFESAVLILSVLSITFVRTVFLKLIDDLFFISEQNSMFSHMLQYGARCQVNFQSFYHGNHFHTMFSYNSQDVVRTWQYMVCPDLWMKILDSLVAIKLIHTWMIILPFFVSHLACIHYFLCTYISI